MSRQFFRAFLCAWVLLGVLQDAKASELTVGLAFKVTSVDPHYHYTGANNSFSRHVFDPLIYQDEDQNLLPGLAVSWRAVDAMTWEFALRRNVKFHDGSDFTAADVAFTLHRAANIPNSPGSFATYIRPVQETIVVDPYTIRLKTARPVPQLPRDLSTFGIVSHRAAADATTADFHAGRGMVGTGPFKFLGWVPNESISVARNENYWGDAPAWDVVTFKLVSNAAARLSALLSGGVDMIEQVPTNDIVGLQRRPGFSIVQKATNRVIYLHMDSARDASPFVTDRAGNPIDQNPLRDKRVRQAISAAINRTALTERVLSGAGVPTAQLMPKGLFGYDASRHIEPYDVKRAVAQIADAGWSQGFGLTLHGASDAIEGGDQICLTIAQLLAPLGIAVKVETLPNAIFSTRAAGLAYSFLLQSWSSETGDASGPLKGILAGYSTDRGWGLSNRGRYLNPQFDGLLERALETLNDSARERLLQEATAVAMADYAIIPLYHQVSTWGMRPGLAYTGRTDNYTFAHQVRPVMVITR